ncbi:TrmJ/YjtD family RNA methyltransferase [Candidatus Micrarchaeota archaeon]|nr:TrmJ/YjtD family RNA methyltransferase [Candidatus Micrarchaeota archaeon]
MYSVIFVEPETAGNVGSVARAMSNFDMKELILVNPKCDVRSDECRATAKHAYWIVENARVVSSFEKAVKEFDAIIGTTGKKNSRARDIRELKKTIREADGRKAIVIGRESTGLNERELALCTALANIPTNNDYPILNASHAAAIAFYELSPQHGTTRSPEKSETDAMMRYFDEATESDSGVRNKDALKSAFRDVIGRSLLSKEEAHILTGFFKSIGRKK